MNSVVYIDCMLKKTYKDDSVWGKIKDKFYIRFEGESFIKELNTKVYRVNLPPNMHEKAFKKNLNTIYKKFRKNPHSSMALKTYRYLDYPFYSEFQKKVLAYSVAKSIQLILMTRNKSIKKDCIAVYDAADEINKHIIIELSQKSKYLMLVSNNIKKTRVLCDYIICNYGISPIITNDIKYVIANSNFIVTSRPIEEEVNCPLWCLDNMYIPPKTKDLIVNEVTFKAPWELKGLDITSELIGGIFNDRGEKNIDRLLYDNGLLFNEVNFNKNDILLYGKK